MDENQNVNGAPIQNGVPNQQVMYNNVPPKKSPVGLIIGIIVGLVVLIGGGLALFFLVIYPNFIEGGGSSNNEEEEEKNWSELYGKYLKKEVTGEYKMALIDMDEDKTPELIVTKGMEIVSISTIKKDKVVTLDVGKYGDIDYVYNVETEKDSWYLINDSATYNFYNLNKALDDGLESLGTVDSVSSEAGAKKYVSLEANINYISTDEDDYQKDLKAAYKEKDKGYTLKKTLEEVKKEVEERNKAKVLNCHQIVTPEGYSAFIDYELTFEGDQLTGAVKVSVTSDFSQAGSKINRDATVAQTKKNYEDMGFTVTQSTLSGDKILLTFDINKSKYNILFGSSYTEDDLTLSKVQEYIEDSLGTGGYCKVA